MAQAGTRPRDDGAPPGSPFDWAVDAWDRDLPLMVRTALAQDRARLAFQPVVAAATGQVAFWEGLVRLTDEAGRVLPAGAFIASVEETTIGRDVDCASLRLGLAMLRRQPRLRLAVNMSARSIGDAAWRRVLEAGLAPGVGERLILEISETSAMGLPDVVIRFMEEMQPRGVAFGLDDFGAGLISFRHLKDFFFDLVKVDRCFVAGIDESPDNQVLAEALVTVAHQFEMFAVAEGVETEGEARHLRSLGIDCLQGYHFGRPQASIPD